MVYPSSVLMDRFKACLSAEKLFRLSKPDPLQRPFQRGFGPCKIKRFLEALFSQTLFRTFQCRLGARQVDIPPPFGGLGQNGHLVRKRLGKAAANENKVFLIVGIRSDRLK